MKKRSMPTPEAFVGFVLSLRPRLAIFDCDGTLWEGDSGEGFMRWTMRRGIVPAELATGINRRYADYKAGRVNEETMCGEMVTMYAGLQVSALEAAAQTFVQENVVPYAYLEMMGLISKLIETGCNVWLVSSTNEWVIRAASQHLHLDPSRVIAAAAHVERGVVTNRLIRVPTDEGKAEALRELVLPRYASGQIDVVFGNSIHDAAMLKMAAHPFAINPTAELQRIATAEGWKTYFTSIGCEEVQLLRIN